ncbi:MAG: ATP-binding cassette domain-containing protein [Thermoplasmata archaeon]|jgi:ABC-2 type transport system ATP-binding protein
MSDAIEVHHLTQRYGSFTALRDVDLSVRQGEIFGLLGPNGAGKTTLIKVLTGLVPPSEGSASIAGLDVVAQERRVKARVGWVASEVILDDDLSAMENLWIQARLQNLTNWKERARDLLQYLGLQDRADWRVSKFSTGMRKKLEVALALLHEPSVIFMDEPTIGLDAATRRMLWDLIRNIHREYGVTVLLTTHYIEEADALCERVAVIDLGRIIRTGTPSELKAQLGIDVIEIETVGVLDPGPLRAIEGVQDVRVDGHRWTFKVREAEEVLPRILAAIPTRELRRVNVERPSLETVFLELTGRRLGGDETPVDFRKFYGQLLRTRR